MSETNTVSNLNDKYVPPAPQLSASFSTYGSDDAMNVEHWLYGGGLQPSDAVIQNGFPTLYYQVYTKDSSGQTRWGRDQHFTEAQRNRWEILELVAGLEPIMARFQSVCNERRAIIESYRANLLNQ